MKTNEKQNYDELGQCGQCQEQKSKVIKPNLDFRWGEYIGRQKYSFFLFYELIREKFYTISQELMEELEEENEKRKEKHKLAKKKNKNEPLLVGQLKPIKEGENFDFHNFTISENTIKEIDILDNFIKSRITYYRGILHTLRMVNDLNENDIEYKEIHDMRAYTIHFGDWIRDLKMVGFITNDDDTRVAREMIAKYADYKNDIADTYY